MTRTLTAAGLAVLIGLAGGCSQQAPEASFEDAWGEFRTAYNEVESAEEKTALAEGVLASFPENEYAGGLANVIAYYRGEEMGDKEGAYTIIEAALARISDPELRFPVQMALFPLAHDLGKPADLGAVADELAAHRALDFSEHLEVMELAAEHEVWPVAESHAVSALALATPEAFRADHEDEELSDEEAAARADRRKVMALAHQGWAMANTERVDEAMAVFESAAGISTTNYLGVPDTALYRYWGLTALANEDHDRALELLGPDAILGDSDEALEGYRAAYAGKHGSEDGFDEHLWSERNKLARVVDDFTVADYDGNQVDLAGLRQGKVVLLAFWFPT